MHLWMMECGVSFLGRLDLDLVSRIIESRAYHLACLRKIINFICGCNLGWRSVAYHFGVTVTLAQLKNQLFSSPERKAHG